MVFDLAVPKHYNISSDYKEQRTTYHDPLITAFMKSHRELEVWQAAIQLAKKVYELTAHYPSAEQFGLVSQMRPSATSIASNIAQGAARQGTQEFVQFLYVAAGSASELDTQIEISKATKIVAGDQATAVQEEVTRITMMLRGLIRSLKAKL